MESEIMEEQKLTIVHLSDLHLKEEESWKQNVILASLVENLNQRIQSLPRDNLYAVISGDLTQDGRKNQFKLVKDFIKDLRKDLGFKKVIVCPGNHDLNRHTFKKDGGLVTLFTQLFGGKASGASKSYASTWRTIGNAEETIENLYDNRAQIKRFQRGMSAYYEFLDQIPQNHSEYLYSIVRRKFGKTSVNFVCLNSALLFRDKTPDDAYGYIGLTQIDRAFCEAISTKEKGCDEVFNIFVFHHPFRRIVPALQKQTEHGLRKRADLILTGHVHELEISIDLTSLIDQPSDLATGPRGQKYPIIASSRCVYDKVKHPSTQPGYSIFVYPSESGRIGRNATVFEVNYVDGAWEARRENHPFTINLLAWDQLNKIRRFGYQDYYDTMAESPHSPESILENPELRKLEFMGTYGDKWVGNNHIENRRKLELFLKNESNSVKFLLLNPNGLGAEELQQKRDKVKEFPLQVHKDLRNNHRNYVVKLYDSFPKYRLSFVNERKVGVLLHAIDKREYEQNRNEYNLPVMEFTKSESSNTLFNFFRDYFDYQWNIAHELKDIFP